jgi:SAM-dependent methyltransferase
MHRQVMDYLKAALTVVGGVKDKRVHEIGSLYVNGGARDLCGEAKLFWGFDKVAGPGVDQVEDARNVVGNTWDLVICTEVLEHDPEPHEIIDCAARCLKAGGYLILTCASTGRKPHSAYGAEHPEPGEYYGNVSPEALRAMLHSAKWELIDLDYIENPGDVRCIARRTEVDPYEPYRGPHA